MHAATTHGSVQRGSGGCERNHEKRVEYREYSGPDAPSQPVQGKRIPESRDRRSKDI